MASPMFSWNSTFSTTNLSKEFDFYCLGLQTGPLVWAMVSVPSALVGLFASVWLLWVLIQRQRGNNSGSSNNTTTTTTTTTTNNNNNSNDVYALHLTTMDLLFNICTLVAVFNYLCWRNEGLLKFNDCVYSLSMCGRPLFTACVCVDSYLAVVWPILYLRHRRSRHRLGACMLVWGLTLLYGTMFLLDKQLFNTFFTVMPYVMSLPIIILCDLKILFTLRKPDPSGRSEVHPQKQRAMQTITNSFIITVVSYLPPLVVFGFSGTFPLTRQQFYCHLGVPALITITLGSTIPPLLYLSNLGLLKLLLNRCG